MSTSPLSSDQYTSQHLARCSVKSCSNIAAPSTLWAHQLQLFSDTLYSHVFASSCAGLRHRIHQDGICRQCRGASHFKLQTCLCGITTMAMPLPALMQPSMTIPTAIGINDYHFKTNYKTNGLDDLDFLIGSDAVQNAANYSISYPVRHGIVSWPTTPVLVKHAN